ncbi:hypothetical protein LTR94_037132, partial [Friedmanniomyces endolithicus]
QSRLGRRQLPVGGSQRRRRLARRRRPGPRAQPGPGRLRRRQGAGRDVGHDPAALRPVSRRERRDARQHPRRPHRPLSGRCDRQRDHPGRVPGRAG